MRVRAACLPASRPPSTNLEAINPGKKGMAVLLGVQAIASSGFYCSLIRFERTAGGCLQPGSCAVCPCCAPLAAMSVYS
eukprot:908730-Pelagomonas_calceolata.AAC.2